MPSMNQCDASSVLDRAIAATRRLPLPMTAPPAAIERAQRLAASEAGRQFVTPAPSALGGRPERSSSRTMFQTALVLALLVGGGAVATLSELGRPASVFAAAIEQVRKISVVRFAVNVKTPGNAGGDLQGTQIETDTGITRLEHAGLVKLIDSRAGRILQLVPAERKAFVSEMKAAAAQPEAQFFECFESIVPKDGHAKGRERIDGFDSEVFEITQGASTQTFWIDPQTRLPVQMTHRFKMVDGEMIITMNHFEWNPAVEPALLAVTIPEGYVRSDIKVAAQDEDKKASGDKKATLIGDFLRLCADADEGRFPDELSRKTVLALVNRLAADPRFADRTDRLGAAVGGLFGVQIGLDMVGEELHYLGKGRRANDGKGIVAWYTLDGTTTAISDDFSIGTIEPQDVPGLPK